MSLPTVASTTATQVAVWLRLLLLGQFVVVWKTYMTT
jgi:hypothetical protein